MAVAGIDTETLLYENTNQARSISRAVAFFVERIKCRYLDQINILNENAYSNGFASMALICLLIDTLFQFYSGESNGQNNHIKYVSFLENRFGDVFDTHEKAERFYKDIRCGILHSAQTKSGSQLSSSGRDILELTDQSSDSPIRVDVVLFSKHVEIYFYNYIREIETNELIQTNFIKRVLNMFVQEVKKK